MRATGDVSVAVDGTSVTLTCSISANGRERAQGVAVFERASANIGPADGNDGPG